jgi:hypothetical protein
MENRWSGAGKLAMMGSITLVTIGTTQLIAASRISTAKTDGYK